MGRPGACDSIRSVEEIPPEGERREPRSRRGRGKKRGAVEKKKKRRSLKRLRFVSEIRVGRKIKSVSGRFDVSATGKFASDSDEQTSIVRLTGVIKSRLLLSLSLVPNKPRELARGSSQESARSAVMSAREVARAFLRRTGRLTWHISGINHRGQQETVRLVTPHPRTGHLHPHPHQVLPPGQPKHGARGANTFPFSRGKEKKSRPLRCSRLSYFLIIQMGA